MGIAFHPQAPTSQLSILTQLGFVKDKVRQVVGQLPCQPFFLLLLRFGCGCANSLPLPINLEEVTSFSVGLLLPLDDDHIGLEVVCWSQRQAGNTANLYRS